MEDVLLMTSSLKIFAKIYFEPNAIPYALLVHKT